MEQLGAGYDAPAGHEKSAVMTLISKYKVDPASYLGGRDTDKEYLRGLLSRPSEPSGFHRKELSDQLGSELSGIYQPMKSLFSSLYSNPSLYSEIGRYN